MSSSDQNAPSLRRSASFGIGLLLLALITVVTGVALLPFYKAMAGAAHPSVQAIQASPLLRVVRGAHHWGSALLILLGGAYVLFGVFTGAYRRPGHVVWPASVGLVLLFLLLQLTGHLLPWDKHAVSTTAIEVGVAENAPIIGPLQARLLRGGEAVSPRTLTVWYVAHVVLLPIALVLLGGFCFAQWRRMAGNEGRRERGNEGTRDRSLLHSFTPSLFPAPRVPLALALLVLVVMAIAVPAPLGRAATPDDYQSFAARSEWYVLPLHGLLSLAQRIRPSLAFVGTMVIPGLVVLCLLALPWLDRRTAGEPPSRWVRAKAVAGIAILLVLVGTNLGHVAPPFGPKEVDETGVQGGASATPLDSSLVQKGKALYEKNGCAGCHKVGGQGGAVGPTLDATGRRHPDLGWQIRHLKNPSAVVPGSTMPPYSQLSDADLKALASYLLSLK